MALLRDFLPHVLPYVDGCPTPVAEHAIRTAYDRFCRDTYILQRRETLQLELPGDTVVGDFETDFFSGVTVNGNLRFPFLRVGSDKYYSAPPTGTRPHVPLSVWCDGEQITAAPVAILDRWGDWTAKTGAASYFTRMPDATVLVAPIPDTPPTVVMRAAYVPLVNATAVPDDIRNNWYEPIAAGALHMLQMTPRCSYSNQKAAEGNRVLYIRGVGRARIAVNRSSLDSTLVMHNTPWA